MKLHHTLSLAIAALALTAPAAAVAKAKPVAKKEPEPVVEDIVGDKAPTMADAVAAATVLVSNGGAGKVKEALAAVGSKRVSEMRVEDIPAFLAALEA